MKTIQKLLLILIVTIWHSQRLQVNAQSLDDQVTTMIDSLPQTVGGVAVDALGYIYLADFEETVWQINPITGDKKVYANGFYGASGNNFDSYGNLYQANFYGNFISKISRKGEVEVFADSVLSGPVGIAIDANNELYVCNCRTKSISKISTAGKVEEFVKSELFRCPNGITFDPSGNLIVVNYYNNNIVKVTPEGEASLLAQTEERLGNGHVVVVNDMIYVTGFHGHKVYQITLEGVVSVLAGTGKRGKKDGSSRQAQFSYPNGIAVSPDQKTLYINDLNYKKNLRIPPLSKTHSVLRTIELTRISDLVGKEMEAKGVKSGEKLYTKLKQNSKYKDRDTKSEIHGLGINYMIEGEYQKAKTVFQMNIGSYPDWFVSYSGMGWTHYLEKNNPEAVRYYKKALSLSPQNTALKHQIQTLESDN